MVDPVAEKIKGIVVDAFRDVPYPGDSRIASHHPCLECDEISRHFREKDWKPFASKPMALIADQRDSLAMLDHGAYHFFLPAFLLASILEYEEADIIPQSLAFEFADPDPRNEERRDRLTPAQRRAIWKTLEYLRDAHPGDLDDSQLDAARRNLGIG